MQETKSDLNGADVQASAAKIPVSFASIATTATDVSVSA
jgi:hypothetical protein